MSMGFKYNQIDETHCCFEAVAEGDDVASFLLCIQKALAAVCLDITVDVSARPAALGAVLPSLFKLQKVISNHGKAVTLKGLPGTIPADFLKRLSDLGFQVLQAPSAPTRQEPPHPPSEIEAQGHIAQSVIEVSMGEIATADMALPPAPEMEARLKDLRGRLAEMLRRKRFLENEKKTYTERLKYISKGLDINEMSKDSMQQIALMEGSLVKMKEEKTVLLKRIEESTGEMAAAEGKSKNDVASLSADYKKKKDGLDKKLAELLKQRDKIQSDFKKKSEQRKQQMTALQKQAKPGT
jgi:hypothetical protein